MPELEFKDLAPKKTTPLDTSLAGNGFALKQKPLSFDDLLPKPGPTPTSTAEKTWNTAEAIGRGLYEGLHEIPAHVEEITGEPFETPEKGEARAAQEKRIAEYVESEEGKKPGLFGSTKGEYVRDIAGQVPQTLEQFGGAIAGAELGAASPIPGGALIGGVAGGLASALIPAYKQDKSRITKDIVEKEDKDRQALGKPAMTLEEKQARAREVEPDASQHALYEVGTEIPGTAVETALALAPGARAAEAIAKPVAKGAWAALKAATVGASKPIAASVISEPIEETVSQQLEQPIEAKYGLTEEKPRELGSLADWAKSYNEVLGPTLRGLAPLILTGGFIGGHGAVKSGRTTQENLDAMAHPEIIPQPVLDKWTNLAEAMSKTKWGKEHEGVKVALTKLKEEPERRVQSIARMRAFDPDTATDPGDLQASLILGKTLLDTKSLGGEDDTWLSDKVEKSASRAPEIFEAFPDTPEGWKATLEFGDYLQAKNLAGTHANYIKSRMDDAGAKFKGAREKIEAVVAEKPVAESTPLAAEATPPATGIGDLLSSLTKTKAEATQANAPTVATTAAIMAIESGAAQEAAVKAQQEVGEKASAKPAPTEAPSAPVEAAPVAAEVTTPPAATAEEPPIAAEVAPPTSEEAPVAAEVPPPVAKEIPTEIPPPPVVEEPPVAVEAPVSAEVPPAKELWQMTAAEAGRKYVNEVVLPQLRGDLQKAKKGELQTGKLSPYKSKTKAILSLQTDIADAENLSDEDSARFAAQVGEHGHYGAVRRALEAGEPVPQNVLDEYPDLKETAVEKAPQRQVNLGRLGRRDVEFPNAEHAELFDYPIAVTGEVFPAERSQRLRTAFGMEEPELREAAQRYRNSVLAQAKTSERGATVKAPFAERADLGGYAENRREFDCLHELRNRVAQCLGA